MSAPNETTAINSTNSAPYLSADRSELAPLFTNPQETKGLRLIAGCFTFISLLISLALAAQVRYGNHQVAPHGSVVSDSSYCSRIGASIIEKGGNSVDAAIAATFCMGLVHPHLTGLGGGGLMLIYDHRQHRIKDCLDFRVSQSKNRDVGIPGLLAGLYQAHYLHGSASWEELLAPSIRMARSGFGVSSSLVMAKRSLIANVSDLRTWLEPLQQGSIITSTQLADTLSIISTQGPDAFYNGSLSKEMVEKASLSPVDMAGYRVERGASLCSEHIYNGYKVIAPSLSGTGGEFLFKALDHLNLSGSIDAAVPLVGQALLANQSELSWRIHSGSVVVATDRSDLYVSIVSGLGSVLGSQILTSSGFILNNAMEMAPMVGSRATHLAVPFICVQNLFVCGQRLISGAPDVRDGLQLIFRLLDSETYYNTSLQSLVDAPRVRFTASTNEVQAWAEDRHVPALSGAEMAALKELGFKLTMAQLPYPSLNVIRKFGDTVDPYADPRGMGEAIHF